MQIRQKANEFFGLLRVRGNLGTKMPLTELESRVRALFSTLQAAEEKAITAPTLAGGGQLASVQGLPGGSGILPKEDDDSVSKAIYIPITKLNDELREVTGVVLQPEVTDAQGDIMDESVIAKAAGDFLAGFNKETTLGLMHNQFNKRFELRQSFIVPLDMTIENKPVKKGSWVMVVKVLDNVVWKAIKDGKITGFSIGGKAKAKKLSS